MGDGFYWKATASAGMRECCITPNALILLRFANLSPLIGTLGNVHRKRLD